MPQPKPAGTGLVGSLLLLLALLQFAGGFAVAGIISGLQGNPVLTAPIASSTLLVLAAGILVALQVRRRS